MKHTLTKLLLFLFVFLLPTQLGKHFFFDFSYIHGVRIDYLAPTIYAIDIVLLALCALQTTIIKRHLAKNRKILFFVAGLFAINIFSSPVPAVALYGVARLFEIYLVYVVIASLNKKRALLMLSAFLVAACVQLGLALAQFVHGGSLQGPFYYIGERFFTMASPGIATAAIDGREIIRPYGTFSHPNSMGGFYTLVYAFSLGLLIEQKNKHMRLALIALSALSTILVFFSFSKAAIGGFVCVTIMYAYLQFTYFRAKGKKICVTCAISRVVIPLLLALVFFQAKGDVYSADKRIVLIEQAMVLLQRFPLFGTGIGNALYYQAQFPSRYAEFFVQPIHNIFLLFAVQAGVIIFFVFAFMYVRMASRRRILIMGAVLLTGLFDHYWLTLIQNMLLVGVVLGLQKK